MRIKRIIIEGPDCSGKSTLVERIKNTLKWDARFLRHKDGDQFSRYLTEYASAENVVFDRSHFSENVYSKLWRGGSPFSSRQKKILNSICQESTLIILACPSKKTLEERYLSREYPQQIKLKELEISRKLFINEFSNVKKKIYKSRDFTELEVLLNQLIKIVEER
jgi:hypothetical protein